MTTPEEIEVGRRRLIAELKDAARSEELGATHNVVLLPSTVSDLLEVLEALAPVDREALGSLVEVYKMLTSQGPVDEFDRGVRAARLQFIDDLLPLLNSPEVKS